MSHIVKGKVSVAYRSKELLLKALEGVGVVVENEKLYRVGAGYTSERYPLVLIDKNDKEHRIGYKETNGIWEQYQEDYGSHGRWAKQAALSRIAISPSTTNSSCAKRGLTSR